MSRFKTLQVVYDEKENVLKKECGTCHELKDVTEFYNIPEVLLDYRPQSIIFRSKKSWN